MISRVALGKRDPAVGDDRAIPVARTAGQRRDEGPGRRLVDAQRASWIVHVKQAAGRGGLMPVSVDYVARETASNLWRNRLMTIAAILTVAVSLTLVGAALLLRQVSDR